MTEKISMEEMSDSLTGYEEVGISTHFGKDVGGLLESQPTMGIRALVFTQKTREGMTAKDAKKASMDLRLSEVMEFFSDDEETNPEDPVTESGEDVPLFE